MYCSIFAVAGDGARRRLCLLLIFFYAVNLHAVNVILLIQVGYFDYTTTSYQLRKAFLGGDGLLLAYEDLGRMFDHSFPACPFFFFFC